jgi:ubiquinone/menaquinone biosynthesis C-methylase UbiE
MAWRYGIHKGADVFIGIDVGLDLLRTFKEKLSGATAIQSEGSVLPLQDGVVDFLCCTEAFEHLPRPDRALKEFARVLRPGGRIVIQSPAATRLRNLNPLHVVQCVIGMRVPAVLQPMVVHEHTWTRTYTYHWDFTHQQLQSYCAGTGLRVVSMMCVTYRFNPNGSALHRMAYMLSRRLPILNRLGWDMTVVFEKAAGEHRNH